MKVSQELDTGIHAFTHYSEGQIAINGQFYTHSLIVSAQRLTTDWSINTVLELTTENLAPIDSHQPEVVLLGTGLQQVFPDTRILAYFLQRGIGCEVMDTGAACRTYNVLAGEGRRVVAAVLPA
ncbi:MAG TPA: hypothetical protein ENJ84_10550 [Gammaproteobacteria bacterium]|nr:hypothetical protein [Gammaproteobacteria bacterium]